MNQRLRSVNDDALVSLYAEAARAHGIGTEAGTVRKTNQAANKVARVYRELRNRGPTSLSLLLRLLESNDPGVRGWVGAHALEFAPDLGEPALAVLSEGTGWIAFSARMTLKVWREGNLRFP
jgi:hypothetical protein